MKFYDIFNGDADGICALCQLRAAEPRDAVLVTGVKRDIRLLARIAPGPDDDITVLDISMAANADGLARALQAGARVEYFDHHFAGTFAAHPNLRAHIDTAPDVCTSLIVDRYLAGGQRIWAVVAAFGDNLDGAARAAAAPLGLDADRLATLRELGELINYNAYGESVDDLHFHPAEMYRALSGCADPFEFVAGTALFATLRDGYRADMERAGQVAPESQGEHGAVYILPDEAWSRRVSGSFGNQLARLHALHAHAVLTRSGDGYLVSVRAPSTNPVGADALCRQFETGGGRSGAAGINHLPQSGLDRFMDAFRRHFSRR